MVDINYRSEISSYLLNKLQFMAFRCLNDIGLMFKFVSEGSLPLVGYEAEALVRNSFFLISLIHQDDAEPFRIEIQRALDNKSSFEVMCRAVCADGTVKWVLLKCSGEYRSDGYAEYVNGFMTDLPCALEYEKLHNANEEIKKLNHKLLDSLEVERERISRDLHDSVGQMILAAKLALKSYLAEPIKNREQIDACIMYIDISSRELREISAGLYPSMLTELGLNSAIKFCIKNYLESAGLVVSYCNISHSSLENDSALQIYRIVQEIFNNIVKHSYADHADVYIEESDKKYVVCIRDNGIGFDVENVYYTTAGSGLINIRQRVNNLNGNIVIDSVKGRTSIIIEIPVIK